MGATVAKRAIDIFQRANKKKLDVRKAEQERDEMLKTVGEMEIENNFLKKIPSIVRKEV